MKRTISSILVACALFIVAGGCQLRPHPSWIDNKIVVQHFFLGPLWKTDQTSNDHSYLPEGADGQIVLSYSPPQMAYDCAVDWLISDSSIVDFAYYENSEIIKKSDYECTLIGLKPGTTTLTIVVENDEDRWTETITITVVEREFTWLVKGEDVTYVDPKNDPVFHADEGYVELPLKRLWTALGGIVQGKDETVCMMYRQGVAYAFRYDDCTLIPEGGAQDVLAVPPGVTRHARREQKGNTTEMMIDHHSLQGLFDLFGVSVTVDYDNKIIDIH